MKRVVELLISGLAVCVGLAGMIWPELYRRSMEEQFTVRSARIGSVVLLVLGIAGLVAILSYPGGPIDFFPA